MIDRGRFFRNGRRSYVFVVFLVSICIFTWVWFKVLHGFTVLLLIMAKNLPFSSDWPPPLPLAALFEL